VVGGMAAATKLFDKKSRMHEFEMHYPVNDPPAAPPAALPTTLPTSLPTPFWARCWL